MASDSSPPHSMFRTRSLKSCYGEISALFYFWQAFGILTLTFNLVQMTINFRYEHVKYILQWPGPKGRPYFYLAPGSSTFLGNNCTYTNCFVTGNKTFLRDINNYDAIVFHAKDINELTKKDLPPSRNIWQKYILTATQSAQKFPICKKYLENYFNLTWTYKLFSDLPRPYIAVMDLQGTNVGPRADMKWVRDMLPITDNMKKRLLLKTEAAAWFVSECKTLSKREIVVDRIDKELKRYGWKVDVFGKCGNRHCSENVPGCVEMLRRDYYFYFAFESSIAIDFVTTVVLTALDNYAVPVVYGGADYSLFLPPNSYLDAGALGPVRLARRMAEIIADPQQYQDFFRWRNHYRIEKNNFTEDVCGLCAMMNDKALLNELSFYTDIRKWFNDKSGRC